MNSLVSSLCLGALPDVRGGSLRSLFFGENAQISFEPKNKGLQAPPSTSLPQVRRGWAHLDFCKNNVIKRQNKITKNN